MSIDPQPAAEEKSKWSPWAIAAAALLLLMFSIVAIGTMRGCFFADTKQAADDEDKKKKEEEEKKKKKADFELKSPIVLPSEAGVPQPPAKPGHWASASQLMTANYRDFVGDSVLTIVNSQGLPYGVAATPFDIRSTRPVLLTKGRPKATQTTFFIPQVDKTINIQLDLEERGFGSITPQPRTPLSPMPSYQYHLVVLAKSPSRYSFVKTLDSVKVPFNGETDEDNTEDTVHYLVVELGADQAASLPDNPLTWSSIAYVIWDQVDPGEPFPADQQKALVDWLHWGGQLIISGPESLDQLKGSFLDPYLPATNGGTRKIAADDQSLVDLNSYWMISTAAVPGVPLKPAVPWSGIKLALRPDAHFLPHTGGDPNGLFAEKQVGRGRVVVSGMRLSERDFINWRSGFESFFNACLLRRPNRTYVMGHFGSASLNWAANELRSRRLDASINTRLFYFSRDSGAATAYHYVNANTDPQYAMQQRVIGAMPTIREYRPPDNPGGIGAWSDFSTASSAARSSLIEAAGVEVPNAGFVVVCLAAYLIALVPINWLIFYTLGRVEWAWIAAPIIAILGTWVIVQRARLDIGFVRSQTEVAILEQQPDHSRAHLSRYTALYTSLSTTYDFEFPNMTTLIAPFPTKPQPSDFHLLSGEGLTPVNFQRYDVVRLTGLPISSNSTGMVHSEQMYSLDGAIHLGKSATANDDENRIENHSSMNLHSACVVRRDGDELKGWWIGNLMPGQSVSVRWSTLDRKKFAFIDNRKDEAKTEPLGRLNLEPLFRLALDRQNIEKGERRFVARLDEVLPGEKIAPAASQVKGATLVVAHLQYGDLPAPEKDTNTRQDIKESDKFDEKGPIEF